MEIPQISKKIEPVKEVVTFRVQVMVHAKDVESAKKGLSQLARQMAHMKTFQSKRAPVVCKVVEVKIG